MMRDFNANLAGKRIFSFVDLMRGYIQILMSSRDAAKTAIITPFGLWQFVRMPFGLKCAAQTFQRFMNRVTQGSFLRMHIIDCWPSAMLNSQVLLIRCFYD